MIASASTSEESFQGPSSDDVDVAIVGGGPGGLACAKAVVVASPTLRVAVYERARQLSPIGFTLGIMGNGFNALEAIDSGVMQKVVEGLLEDGNVVQHDLAGNELFRFPSAVAVWKEYSSRTGHIPWHELQAILAESLPSGTCRLGHALRGLEENATNVTLAFENGRQVRAGLVIGADGNQSVVRQLILGDGEPHFADTAVWRGQVAAPPAWPYTDNYLTGWAAGKQLLMVVRLRSSMLGWQAMAPWSKEDLGLLMSKSYIGQEDRDAPAEGKKERCLSLYAKHYPPVAVDLLRTSEAQGITEHGQFYREAGECQVWGRGRVSLAGDAAHLMTPFLGQGVNQALEDAVALGRAIAAWGPCPDALRAYEAVRVAPATAVQEGSVQIAKSMASGNKLGEIPWYASHPWVLRSKPAPLRAHIPCTVGLFTRS